MGYQVLALKYRPKTFAEVLGQAEIMHALANGLARGRLANAYLLAGPRGVGKTSTARILARSLNCVNGPIETPCNECENCREVLENRSLDLLEVDGASNRGIDEVRTINENVRFLPVKSRYKIYLIDEVHMLTDPAFNALLKTLEEPPSHIKFIFATTRPDKLLPTIISRCQRFDFHLISVGELSRHLAEIAEQEGVKAEPAALIRVGQAAAGSFRDSLSILDQLAAFRYGETISVSDVERLLSLVPEMVYLDVLERIFRGERKACLEALGKIADTGYDLFQFVSGLFEFSRYLLLIKLGSGELVVDLVTPESAVRLQEMAGRFERRELIGFLEKLAEERDRLKYEDLIRVRLEVSLLKLVEEFGRGGKAPVGEPGPAAKTAPEKRAAPPSASPQEEKKAANFREAGKNVPSGEGGGAAGKEKPSPAVEQTPAPGKIVAEKELSGPDAPAGIPPKSAAPAAATPVPSGNVHQCWTGFLEGAAADMPFLFPALKSGQLKAIDASAGGKIIRIVCRDSFQQGLLDRNQRVLSEHWQKIFREKARFETVLEKAPATAKTEPRPGSEPSLAERPAPGPVSAAPAAHPKAADPDAHHHVSLSPEEEVMVRKVLDLFGGEVASIGKET